MIAPASKKSISFESKNQNLLMIFYYDFPDQSQKLLKLPLNHSESFLMEILKEPKWRYY